MNSYLQTLTDLFAKNGFTKFDENLRQYFTELGVKVNFNEELFLLWCSSDQAQDLEGKGHMWARACNGPIFEKETLRLVCGTQNHMYKTTPEILGEDVNNYTTEMLLDGTFIRLYYYRDEWRIATCRQIDGSTANWTSPRTFGTLFSECQGTTDIEELSTDVQYYYVMCHVENRLVSVHPVPTAFLVGMSDTTASLPSGCITSPQVGTEGVCHFPRGIVYISKTDGEKLCYEYPEFTFLRDTIRGNNARMDYRYLELLCEDSCNGTQHTVVLRQNWPEWTQVFMNIDTQLQTTAKTISYEYYTTYTRPRMLSRQTGERPKYNVNEKSRYRQTLKQLDAEYYNKKIERVDPTTTLQHMLTRLKPGVLSWLMFWDTREKNQVQ